MRLMSRATTLVSVNQQLAVSAGVAVGAASVETTMWFHHVTELSAGLFAPAFVVVSIISTLSAYFFWEMPADAGHQVSGRGVIVIPSPERDAEPEETAAAETANARDQRLGGAASDASIVAADVLRFSRSRLLASMASSSVPSADAPNAQ